MWRLATAWPPLAHRQLLIATCGVRALVDFARCVYAHLTGTQLSDQRDQNPGECTWMQVSAPGVKTGKNKPPPQERERKSG